MLEHDLAYYQKRWHIDFVITKHEMGMPLGLKWSFYRKRAWTVVIQLFVFCLSISRR